MLISSYKYMSPEEKKIIESAKKLYKLRVSIINLVIGIHKTSIKIQSPHIYKIFEKDIEKLMALKTTNLSKRISSVMYSNIAKKNYAITQKQYYLEYFLTELALHIHSIILLILLENFFPGDKANRKTKKISKTAGGVFSIVSMGYNNIYVSLYEARNLFFEGKDFHAEIMFRNFMELMDLNIALLIDHEFYSIYKTIPNNEIEAKLRWNKIKPSMISKKVENYIEHHVDLPLKHEFLDARRKIYNDYSKSAHGLFESQYYSAFRAKKPFSNEEFEKRIFSFFDFNHAKAQDFLLTFIIYNYCITFCLTTIFIKKYGLPMKNFKEIGSEFVYIFKLYEHLLKIYAKECGERMEKSTES